MWLIFRYLKYGVNSKGFRVRKGCVNVWAVNENVIYIFGDYEFSTIVGKTF